MRALALAGPTACGKSEFALTLAARINGEIVSVDSGAVYKKMDIGTAKPSAAARMQIPHHLIDVCSPNENFNAGMFCRLAAAAAADIVARGKTPLLAGGTMMYFYALSRGMHDMPEISAAVRNSVLADMQKFGAAAMHKKLTKLDAATAQKIGKNDSHRIARALEIIAAARRPVSELANQTKPPPALNLSFIFLTPTSRAELRKRIAARLDGMFAAGLIAETKSVTAEFGLHENSPPLRMAGYRQAAMLLRGECSEADAKKRACHATCQLAKRQLTWLRNWQGAVAARVDPFAADAERGIMAAAKSILDN